MNVEGYVEERRAMVTAALQEFVQSHYRGKLMEAVSYLAFGGKQLRGVAAILMCEGAIGQPQNATVASCAVELSHAASLAKDDVADGDQTRRGKPAFWKNSGLS